MGIEEEIRNKLQQGFSPALLVEQGFKKSTVYKVYDTIRQLNNPINLPQWVIENIQFNQPYNRYMPGNNVRVSFWFKNKSDRDFYVVNVGLRTEWMIQQNQSVWSYQPTKELLKPGHTKFVSISFDVPNDLALGEYDLYFGVEGQYLPVQNYEDGLLATQWSEPLIIQVKKPMTGVKIFLSHSVQDQHLIRELEKRLDENGIEVIIGEDVVKPGEQLEAKFKQLINSCTIFLALLTESAMRSKWVNEEIQYAINLNKSRILLKDKSVRIDWNYEWTEFDSNAPPHITLQIIMQALNRVPQNNNLSPAIAGLIGIALLGLVAGALSER